MDAVTLLDKNIDVKKLLHHYQFEKIVQNGDIIRACCKIHGGDEPTAFVININTGYWYCHTNCGGGDIYTLVQKMEKCNFTTAVKFIAKFFDVNIKGLEIVERKKSYVRELRNWMKLMKDKSKNNELREYSIEEEIKKVKKFRGFKEDTLEHFGLGYVEKVELQKRNGEKYMLSARLTFPIIFGGIQVGISFRRVKKKDYPKWSHQPAEIEIRNILYNYDNVKEEKSIVIVEGITDVWAFHEIGVPAVATFGAHITNEQYRLLMKTGADLIFAFDGDDAGHKALKKAIDMFKYKANIWCIEFDKGKDPESISREELYESYVKRRRV